MQECSFLWTQLQVFSAIALVFGVDMTGAFSTAWGSMRGRGLIGLVLFMVTLKKMLDDLLDQGCMESGE